MKKLYRVREGAMLAGVCGGIGEYFRIDPNFVRVAAVVLACMGTLGLWAYLLAAVILPRKPETI